jgi:hypothetical protein
MKKIFIGLVSIILIININFTYGYWAEIILPSHSESDCVITIGEWEELQTYNFAEDSLEDLIADGAWTVSGSYVSENDYLTSHGGYLYIPNPNESYTLTIEAEILSSNTSKNGGYGILFDTISTDENSASDSGYIIQFDRGFGNGEIIIRQRVNGKEQAPDLRYGIYFDENDEFSPDGGLKNKSNAWWTDIHTLAIEITVLDESTNLKNLAVTLDGTFLFNYEYTSDIFDDQVENNVTGFRVWGGVDVAFHSLNIN